MLKPINNRSDLRRALERRGEAIHHCSLRVVHSKVTTVITTTTALSTVINETEHRGHLVPIWCQFWCHLRRVFSASWCVVMRENRDATWAARGALQNRASRCVFLQVLKTV
jgi:hypothetical protein